MAVIRFNLKLLLLQVMLLLKSVIVLIMKKSMMVLPEASCIQTNIPLNSTVSITGDNLDKNIKPRDINHQVKSHVH